MSNLIENVKELKKIIDSLKDKDFNHKGLNIVHHDVGEDLTRNLQFVVEKIKKLDLNTCSYDIRKSLDDVIKNELDNINLFLERSIAYRFEYKN